MDSAKPVNWGSHCRAADISFPCPSELTVWVVLVQHVGKTDILGSQEVQVQILGLGVESQLLPCFAPSAATPQRQGKHSSG